jgi:hypothetical protein
MIFKEKQNTELMCRLVSENELIEIGIYPVMFGMRIRAGFVGTYTYEIDYCAGSDQMWVEALYSAIKCILENRPEERSCFNGFPLQTVKPMINDPACFTKLSSMNTILKHTKLPSISILRKEYFDNNDLKTL